MRNIFVLLLLAGSVFYSETATAETDCARWTRILQEKEKEARALCVKPSPRSTAWYRCSQFNVEIKSYAEWRQNACAREGNDRLRVNHQRQQYNRDRLQQCLDAVRQRRAPGETEESCRRKWPEIRLDAPL